jgi:MYXO-CTERM domain-containing protein
LARKRPGRSLNLRNQSAAAGMLVALLVSLPVVLRPTPARANGALPASYGILLPTDKPQQVVLATNFGMIISEDAGKSWLWTCERPETSFGYLYGVGPAPRDRFYALSPDTGLAVSDDASCTWQRSGGALASLVASDFFIDPTNADRVVAVATPVDSGTGDVGPPAVFQSLDGGTTFAETPLYTAPAGANIVSLEIARRNPMVIYLAMYTTPDRHPRLVRSADGGQTWMERDVEASLGANEFRILTVDPDDENVLYVRVIALGMESVAVTRDAGMTFATPVTITKGTLSAFVRLASGTVLVGGLLNLDTGGMNGTAYRSTDGGTTFLPWTLTPQPHILGLAERAGVLYIAGKNYSDGWALATSRDEGVTIAALSTYADVHGIKPCAMPMCGDQCKLVSSQAVWTNDVCTWVPETPPPSSSGCHCAAGERAGGTAAVWVVAGLVLAIHRRRRRF